MESKKLQEKLDLMHQHLYNADLDLREAQVCLADRDRDYWDADGYIDIARRELDTIYRFLYALQEESRQQKSFTNLYKKVLDFFRRKP